MSKSKTGIIITIISIAILMAGGIIAIALTSSGSKSGGIIGSSEKKLEIPNFNTIILPHLLAKLKGCGGGNNENLVGKSCPWTLSSYPKGQANDECNQQLDACNYERPAWTGGETGTEFDDKYKGELWDNFNYTFWIRSKSFYTYPLSDSTYSSSGKKQFYPTTKIDIEGDEPSLSTSFQLAKEINGDVYTNKNNKLKTSISLKTYTSFPSLYTSVGHVNTSRYLDSPFEYGKYHDFIANPDGKLMADVSGYIVNNYSMTASPLNPKQKSFIRYTKGQIYIYYKTDIDYYDGTNTLNGNFWYFITITGKENAVQTNNTDVDSTVVPYGHTDRMIVDTTDVIGANFGTSIDNITDYSHYLTDEGQEKQNFPLSEIMKNPNSSAYAVKVNNKYDDKGIGYVIEGSVFETDDNLRSNNKVKYKKDKDIQLKWS
jgi:hypothetical protein